MRKGVSWIEKKASWNYAHIGGIGKNARSTMGEYPGFPPDRDQVNHDRHAMQFDHRWMQRFEAMNARLLIAVILALLVVLVVLVAMALGVEISMVLGGM